MMELFSEKNIDRYTRYTDLLFSSVIFITILGLIVYSVRMAFDLLLQSFDRDMQNIVHNIAYIIVLMKAYKIMVYYFRYQNLSIKYLVQISIIAPAIELIFAVNNQPLWVNVLYLFFSLANLMIYILYSKQLDRFDVLDKK